MKALYIKPRCKPEIINISNDINVIRELLNCEYIEYVYPFDDNVCLICDDVGLISGKQKINRKINEYTTIFGPFILFGMDEADNLIELDDELIYKYYKMFEFIEIFVINTTSDIVRIKISDKLLDMINKGEDHVDARFH